LGCDFHASAYTAFSIARMSKIIGEVGGDTGEVETWSPYSSIWPFIVQAELSE